MNDNQLMDEPGRVAALKRLAVLDTAPEAQFDKIVALVCAVLDVPRATVTLIDEDRQWFKARAGIDDAETPRVGSFCTHTIGQRAPLVVEDASCDPRFAGSPFVTGPAAIRAYAGVPLTTPDGYNVGALCAIDIRPRTFTPTQLDMLGNFAGLVVDELELRQLASSDQLTGALSRRGFLTAVDKEMERCRRYRRPAALALLDIDHFKRINDTWGHPAGDAVLRQLATRCRPALRPSDAFGRIGGEEFALLLSESTPAAALKAAERIRAAIAAEGFAGCGDTPAAVTASFGIAPFAGQRDAEAWIAAADAPLYAAKHGGRNRCVMAPGARLRAA